jgi:O-antigen ligase
MHSITAYPLLQRAPIAAPRGRMIDYIRAATFPIWMFSLQLPFWYVTDWTFWQESFEFRTYYYVGFGICLAAHLALGFTPWIRAPFQIVTTWSGAFITAFCALALLLSPLSLKPSATAVYAASTWAVYVLVFIFWQTEYRIAQRMIVLTGMIILAWQIILSLRLGVQVGLSIGGILRNYTGQAALAAMACCMMSPRKSVRWLAITAALFFCLLVNSRGSILAIAVFQLAYFGLYKGTVRAVLYGLLAMVLIGCAALAVPRMQKVVLEDVMRLHDKVRGAGSGLTGRSALNKSSSAVWQKPIFGYGFRVSTQGVEYSAIHSGYLKILVETGFVGAFLIIGAVLIETFRRFRIVNRIRQLPPAALPHIDIVETMRLNVIAFATLCTTLTIWVYEPLYINLGSVSSLLFWLMIASPTCVTKQGASIRSNIVT